VGDDCVLDTEEDGMVYREPLFVSQLREKKLQEEIARARHIYAEHRERMFCDELICGLLAAYRDAILETGRLMEETGVIEACTRCAVEGPGSCCFQGIEEGYDYVLILINLLLSCDIPDTPEVQGSCFFVGENGCRLQGRFSFCLNYLCPDLQELIGPADRTRLLRTVGNELTAGWELEHALRLRFGKQ
jgi:hypothetical protein